MVLFYFYLFEIGFDIFRNVDYDVYFQNRVSIDDELNYFFCVYKFIYLQRLYILLFCGLVVEIKIYLNVYFVQFLIYIVIF